jgi:hypothetical protein
MVFYFLTQKILNKKKINSKIIRMNCQKNDINIETFQIEKANFLDLSMFKIEKRLLERALFIIEANSSLFNIKWNSNKKYEPDCVEIFEKIEEILRTRRIEQKSLKCRNKTSRFDMPLIDICLPKERKLRKKQSFKHDNFNNGVFMRIKERFRVFKTRRFFFSYR